MLSRTRREGEKIRIGGVVEKRLKNKIVRNAGRKVSPNNEAPNVPDENVEVVQLAANQSHMQSVMDV